MLSIDISLLNIEQFIDAMKPKLINQYQTKDDMKSFRDMAVELTYAYQSEEGIELVNITIFPRRLYSKLKSNKSLDSMSLTRHRVSSTFTGNKLTS